MSNHERAQCLSCLLMLGWYLDVWCCCGFDCKCLPKRGAGLGQTPLIVQTSSLQTASRRDFMQSDACLYQLAYPTSLKRWDRLRECLSLGWSCCYVLTFAECCIIDTFCQPLTITDRMPRASSIIGIFAVLTAPDFIRASQTASAF